MTLCRSTCCQAHASAGSSQRVLCGVYKFIHLVLCEELAVAAVVGGRAVRNAEMIRSYLTNMLVKYCCPRFLSLQYLYVSLITIV